MTHTTNDAPVTANSNERRSELAFEAASRDPRWPKRRQQDDAPVTVALTEAARRIYRALEMSAAIMRDTNRTGGWEGAERTASAFERQAIAAKSLHDRLADLASAPAGDGDANEVLYGIIRSLRSVLQNIANEEGDTVLGRRCMAAISKSRVPNSARPRAAVGEREAEAAQRLQAFADGAGLFAVYGPEWCLSPTRQFRADLAAILALQSPPAKVEAGADA